MVYRLILPNWAADKYPSRRRVLEGEYTFDQLLDFNEQFYNIYFLPNYPSLYDGGTVDGSKIDKFEYVFVDMDLKDGYYQSKEQFIDIIKRSKITPSFINDSGNGVHVYFKVSDLEAMSYLRLQRRLMRLFKTDEAVGQIYQLMRVADTMNTKSENDFKLCTQVLYNEDAKYTCEELDALLPIITRDDEEYCQQHYDKTYNEKKKVKVEDQIPVRFSHFLNQNSEARSIWMGEVEDRSAGDFRLGHLMYADGFSKQEATSVLVNTAKAIARAPIHRVSYATNIVDQIWIFEGNKNSIGLSSSVIDILQRSDVELSGVRFPCYEYIDDTKAGFRIGQVVGLVAGSGVGKTAIALNMFKGFVKNNPDYIHFFVPLEQPAGEIALRWKALCGEDTQLHSKVRIISNYADDGTFRHLSLQEIQNYIIQFQKDSSVKVGCVVIDHIGALKKKGKNGENQDLMEICHSMKSFAKATNTMLVMQSQAPREKAGIGDLELNKDAAYGTVYFESYCDYLITLWQPLKRCHSEEGCPTITAFKFCKIRHKNQKLDRIKEDVCYTLKFDPESGSLSTLSSIEQESVVFWNSKATNKRKADRKTDVVMYTAATWVKGEVTDGRTSNNQNSVGTTKT